MIMVRSSTTNHCASSTCRRIVSDSIRWMTLHLGALGLRLEGGNARRNAVEDASWYSGSSATMSWILRTGDVQLESTGELLWPVRKLEQAELPSWRIPFRRRFRHGETESAGRMESHIITLGRCWGICWDICWELLRYIPWMEWNIRKIIGICWDRQQDGVAMEI